MKFTKAENKKLFGERLNKNNVLKDERYIPRIKINAKGTPTRYKTGGGFDNIPDCNRAQEKMQKEYDNSRII